MAFSDIFKSKEFKARIESLEAENSRLEAMLTPEMRDAITLQKTIESLNAQKVSLEEQLNKCTSELQSAEDVLSKKKDEIIINDEIIELE